MGFADKLRSTINKVTDTVQSAVDTAQSGYNPFPDDISKKYYEIAYGLLSSVCSISKKYGSTSITYHNVSFDAIKKYVEFYLKEPCDDVKLLSILDKYFAGHNEELKGYCCKSDNSLRQYVARDNNIPAKTISNLIQLNEVLNLKKSYMCSNEEIYDICYKETIENIKDEFNYVFKVVEEYNDLEYFEKGLREITKKYRKTMPIVLLNPLVDNLVYDSFWSRNPITEKCFLKLLYSYMSIKAKHAIESLEYFSSFALRVVHFENYTGNSADYSSVTEEECRDFVMNFDAYAKRIKEHPFDRDEYIDKCIKDIKKIPILKYDVYGRSYEEETPQNNYFIDYMCNLAWKEISGIYEVDGMDDKGKIANVLFTFAKKSENENCNQEIEYDE